MEFSKFGQKFGANSGITSLMDDLGEALSGESEMIMMGGWKSRAYSSSSRCLQSATPRDSSHTKRL